MAFIGLLLKNLHKVSLRKLILPLLFPRGIRSALSDDVTRLFLRRLLLLSLFQKLRTRQVFHCY